MTTLYDVAAIGEPIIDFVPLQPSPAGNLVYEAFTGGGACNVLAQVAAFGGRSAIIGAVGHDLFGSFLAEKLRAAGVATPALHRTEAKNTGIGFVHLSDSGERSFTFYRNPEAPVDLFLPGDEAAIAASRIFHCTSVSLPGASIRASTFAAVECARRHGVLVSFDVNFRPGLWRDPDGDAKNCILRAISRADIVKLSEEERQYLYGGVTNRECASILHDAGVTVAAISMGEKGSFFSYPGGAGECPGRAVRMVDSTGCGDAFAGVLLAQLAGFGNTGAIGAVPVEAMRNAFTCANAAGAICASRLGSFSVMATKREIIDSLRR